VTTAPKDRTVRERKSPYVKPSQFVRRCVSCGTDFLRTEGGSAERGLWINERWYCSIECAPAGWVAAQNQEEEDHE
jgi:hypothetical protein